MAEADDIDPANQLTGPARTAYEASMICLALLVVALLPLEPQGWVRAANIAVWALFVADYAVRLGCSSHRRRFVRTQWIDLVAILPLDFFRAARVLRLGRLLKLVRTVRIVSRAFTNVRGVLRTNGLDAVLVLAMTLMMVGALAIWSVEPDIGSFTDALWWSAVTTTTVGYGDLSPTTGLGRIVAVLLMLIGIGTIGMVTGSIATYFLGGRRQRLPAHVEFVRDELDRWHELNSEERRRLVTMMSQLAEETPPSTGSA